MPARATDPRTSRLVAAYEALQPGNVPVLVRLYAEQARFVDPFNDVIGRAAIERIFRHMFDALVEPAFSVQLAVSEGDDAFLTWQFRFRLREGASPMTIDGATHLRFDGDGLVTLHQDYWDAAQQWYGQLPVVGAPMRWSRRLFSAG
jgi:ketosteroid isomerase-like protein